MTDFHASPRRVWQNLEPAQMRILRTLQREEMYRDRKPVTLPAFWSIRSDQILEGVAQ